MSITLPSHETRLPKPIEYPDSDGEPMADNTEQFLFIQTFHGNLDALIADFVAGDHLWYPVEGRPDIRIAPDVYVAIGRPKGHRGSYRQWEEAGIPPRVVFEWWSPKNDFPHQVNKLRFYDRYGVEEFYTFDQMRQVFSAFIRQGDQLEPVRTDGGFTSPLLGVRFETIDGVLRAWHPDGRPFRSMIEMEAERARVEQECQRAEQERGRAEQERERAEQERERAVQERERAEQGIRRAEARAVALEARLRELGIEPP